MYSPGGVSLLLIVVLWGRFLLIEWTGPGIHINSSAEGAFPVDRLDRTWHSHFVYT